MVAPQKAVAPKTNNKPNLKVEKISTPKSKPVIKQVAKSAKVEKIIVSKKVEEVKKEVITPTSKVTLPDSLKTILISQPNPQGEKSPYHELAKRHSLKIDFKPFLSVESISLKEFRKLRIIPSEFSAIIFNSRNAIDYFFKICEEMRVKMAQETKYFCVSETIALYLQKYIQYRKRKVFYGDGSVDELKSILNKHKLNEKYLLPCSAIGIGPLPEFLQKNGFVFIEAIMYRTVTTDFKGKELNHEMITFFNPEGVRAFIKNFPNYKQGNKLIGAFGEATQKLLESEGFRIHARAPFNEIKSMSMAIDRLVTEIKSKKNS